MSGRENLKHGERALLFGRSPAAVAESHGSDSTLPPPVAQSVRTPEACYIHSHASAATSFSPVLLPPCPSIQRPNMHAPARPQTVHASPQRFRACDANPQEHRVASRCEGATCTNAIAKARGNDTGFTNNQHENRTDSIYGYLALPKLPSIQLLLNINGPQSWPSWVRIRLRRRRRRRRGRGRGRRGAYPNQIF